MTTRSANRHNVPRGRHAVIAAYEGLAADTASLRTQVERDRLDQVTLGATVTKLLGDVGRLSTGLAGVRQELSVLRMEVRRVQQHNPARVPDPLIAMLAEHSADLREQLTSTQLVVAELAGRLTEVLTGALDGRELLAVDPADPGSALVELEPGDGPGAERAGPEEPVDARADEAQGAARRVVRLAPIVTRLDSVPELTDRDQGAEPDPVRVTAARLHAVRRSLDG